MEPKKVGPLSLNGVKGPCLEQLTFKNRSPRRAFFVKSESCPQDDPQVFLGEGDPVKNPTVTVTSRFPFLGKLITIVLRDFFWRRETKIKKQVICVAGKPLGMAFIIIAIVDSMLLL